MLRSISLLVVGVVLGLVAGIYFAVSDGEPLPAHTLQAGVATDQYASEIPDASQSGPPEPVATIRSHQDRLGFYQQVADANTDELVTMLQALARTANSPSRQFALQALVTRYAESDPQGALALTRNLALSVPLRASVYVSWAVKDRDAGLAAIHSESDTAVARKAGLLLVREFGGDSAALLEVIDALPANIDQLSFQIDALVEQAQFDPSAAILQASNFTNSAERHRALRRIARDMASFDAGRALAAAAAISDEDNRRSFHSELMAEWANVDPASLLDHLAATGVSEDEAELMGGRAFAALAGTDPERLLELAEQWPGSTGQQARYAAIRQWAETDPQNASAFALNMPPGRQRDNLLRSVASGFGQIDAAAAIAWVNSLPSKPRGIFSSVIEGIAGNDADRAFDLALSFTPGAEQAEAMQGVIMRTAYGDNAANIATRVLEIEDEALRRQSLQMLAYSWADSDPKAVINWLETNSAQLPSDSLGTIARQIAETDPALATTFTNRIPAESRADWIQNVVASYAKTDAAAAMSWLSQYQGEAGYERALRMLAEQSATDDPIAAARNIEQFPDASNAAIVARVAGREWSRQDPKSAAAWAASIGNDQVRNIAITNVARQWAQQNADETAQWALQLPAGNSRDSALASAVSGIATTRVPEAQLFAEFSSDLARQQAAVYASYRLARTNRAAALQLVDKYVTDPTLRSQVEQNFASIAQY